VDQATRVSLEVDRFAISGATGLWTIASSDAVVVIDADAGRALWCSRSDPARHYRGRLWVTLVTVIGYQHRISGVVQVGDRHRYTYDLDPEADATDFRWWNQGPVQTITGAEEGEVPVPRLRSMSP
jgi:hypothetical protein